MRQAVRAIVIKDDHLLIMQRNKFGHQYYSLVGGGIDMGESAEQALYREVAEETGITITTPRLVIIEDAGSMYGIQYIYSCEYVSGEPVLSPDSAEAKIHAGGQNLFVPMWLPLAELPATNLLPIELKQLLLAELATNFSGAPIALTINS
ncbi:MAG: NUDIX hydrolase [Candidatus Saccharibacteria bacterium]